MSRVGVLALQGDFAEHVKALDAAGAQAVEVRLPVDLEEMDALVIPGGESTTIARLMDVFGLTPIIRTRVKEGMPVLGTCAGMIVLSKQLADVRPTPLGLIDIRVRRNAYGRQVDSFETDLDVSELGPEPFRAVFIRAPGIDEMGPGVTPLANMADGSVVAARQGNVVVAAFHPELTDDIRIHSYFLSLLHKDE